MVFLPEACDYIAETKEASLQLAEPIQGPQVTRYRELAASSSVWLSLGGIHIKVKRSPDKMLRGFTNIIMFLLLYFFLCNINIIEDTEFQSW